MISRRNFLGASTAATAGAALSHPDELLGSPQSQELPPSIARLTSWADRARPITTEERSARVEKAKQFMRANDMDALFLTGGTSMVYYTNIRWGGGERLFTVVVPVNGDAFVVCPAFEEDRAREQLALGPLEVAGLDARHREVEMGVRGIGEPRWLLGLSRREPVVDG